MIAIRGDERRAALDERSKCRDIPMLRGRDCLSGITLSIGAGCTHAKGSGRPFT
jgi:hypothetical protein